MSRLRVAPIVEGHGEVNAVRTLLDRIWRDIVGGEYVEVLQPIRQKRTKLVTWELDDQERRRRIPNNAELERAVGLAVRKLQEAARNDPETPELVLLLLDANSDCPAELAPLLLEAVTRVSGTRQAAVVLPNREYETWFVAAAASLEEYLELEQADREIHDADQGRHGKGWIESRWRGAKYSETVDQVKLTARMDLGRGRTASRSFDKLCRTLEACRS